MMLQAKPMVAGSPIRVEAPQLLALQVPVELGKSLDRAPGRRRVLPNLQV